MAVDLLIRDGVPHWYLSPDIWVVPGSDPSGVPGTPVAGAPSFLWARLSNKGSTNALGVRVDFYWANPALQVTRSNATLVGSAFADVPAEGEQDALCLIPWVPIIVNNGHECLVAVANHPLHPLPNPLPDAFDPPTYPQIAQKNLSVIGLSSLGATIVALTVSAGSRVDKAVTVTAQLGDKLDEASLAGLGLHGLKPAPKAKVEVGLNAAPRMVCEKDSIGDCELKMHIPKGSSKGIHAAIRAKNLGPKEYQFIQIIEHADDKVIGGLGFVVVGQASNEKEAN